MSTIIYVYYQDTSRTMSTGYLPLPFGGVRSQGYLGAINISMDGNMRFNPWKSCPTEENTAMGA